MMRPFRFRLASVLTLWQRREDAALANLLRNQAATRDAQLRLSSLVEARADAARRTHVAVAGTHAPDDPAWHRNWIVHLSLAIEAARDDLGRCEALEQTARTAWQRARRDRRVLERLRDRALRRHQVETRRDEMKVMDELAGLRVRPLLPAETSGDHLERHTW